MTEPDCPHNQGVEFTPWRRMFQAGEVIKVYPGNAFCKLCGWWQYETDAPEGFTIGWREPAAVVVSESPKEKP